MVQRIFSTLTHQKENFETVQPIPDLRQEMELVQRETNKLLSRANIPTTLKPDMTELLVTTFHELRQGQTGESKALETLSTAMSTAEAVSVGYAAGIHAYYYARGEVTPDHLVQGMIGSALKDSAEDLQKLRHYFEHVVRGRKGRTWQAYYEAKRYLG